MDFLKTKNEIEATIQNATEISCNIWRIWRYTNEGRLLFLCGYDLPFDVRAFLVFRGVSRLCVGDFLEVSNFQLVDNSDGGGVGNKIVRSESEHVIAITLKNTLKSHYIVCEELMLLSVPKGATV